VTRIALVGDRDPQYVTHRALDAVLERIPGEWVPSERAAEAAGYGAVWIAPGTPYRDDAAVLALIDEARRSGQPLLATCGGFQYAALALAGPGARHAETSPDAPDPLIAPLACTLYGERRTVTPVAGTRLAEIVGADPFEGFHFCGYGLAAPEPLVAAGARICAHAPDAGVEAFELPEHPFFIATLFQPQMSALDGGPLSALVLALAQRAVQP
jgi:CTP synthase (UTP-ammonia lyase)